MIRLAISVEGRTEEEFVNGVLAEQLRVRQVEATPILVGRAFGNTGGGNVSVQGLASDMAKLYWNFDFVTSLVDYYGFDGKGECSPDELQVRISDEVGGKMDRDWDRSLVFPYVQQHEFEGLLFSDVGAFASLIDMPEESIGALQRIRATFRTPEDINDNSATAPSKRIALVVPRYHKVVYGPLVAMETGLEVIRNECPRFGNWLTRLESLGSAD